MAEEEGGLDISATDEEFKTHTLAVSDVELAMHLGSARDARKLRHGDEALLAHHARTQLVLLRLDPAAPAAEHQAPPRPAPPPVPGARDAERRGAAGARSGRR